MTGRRALIAALVVLVGVVGARAGYEGRPAHSLSPEGLAKVSDYIRNEVATGKIPGAILLLQQHGKPVYYENFGVRDVATEISMSADTIFRLYSMSKPITSVMAMMLVEEGKLALDDPVSKYIPAFAGMKVGVEKKAEDGKVGLALEPLDRPVTIKDLMRHTSGLPYGYYGGGAVRELYAEAKLFNRNLSNADFAAKIATLPLVEQPGTVWDYGFSTDVLGRVVEVISGKTLLQFEKGAAAGSARHDRDGILRRRSRQVSPHCRADAGGPQHQSDDAGPRYQAAGDLGVGRWRDGWHRRRLRPFRADAAERRHL